MCNQLGERFTGPQIWTPNSNFKFLATHEGPIYWYSDMPWSHQKPSPSLLHGWCHNFVVSVTGGQKQALLGWNTILSMEKWALKRSSTRSHLMVWIQQVRKQFGISQSFIMIIFKTMEIVIIWPLISLNTLLIGITYMCISWLYNVFQIKGFPILYEKCGMVCM